MTAGVAMRSPTAIFELVANFLELCNFSAAANAIQAQCRDREPVLEADLLKNFRDHIDSCAMLLAELEVLPKQVPREAAIHQLLDNLLRKLMATGQSLSDDRLIDCIDGALKSDAFPKLALSDIVLDTKQMEITAEILNINDDETYRFWEGIQRESQTPVVEAAAEQTAEQTAEAQAAPVQPVASQHYRPKRRNSEVKEVWDEGDEYHDDDDPGYRIREIYEAELLDELSNKMPETGKSAPAESVADELVGAAAAEQEQGATGSGHRKEVVDSPLPTGGEDGQDSRDATEVLGATPTGSAPEARSLSPTFGGGGGEKESLPVDAPELKAAFAGVNPGQLALDEAEAQALAADDEKKRQQHRRDVKYAASGDSFYPVDFNGVVFDSFNLRVVFERDKTGFEESKEFPIRTNTVVAARYQIIEYLGSAAFSRAVQCLDLESNKMVCMKIIKNDKDFFDQSLDEIKLLKYINVNGDVDKNSVLRLYDHFYHKEHLIIVTELLRDNLYEFSKYNRECGDEPYFTIGRLQKISKQILGALEYVHSLRLIHCDLKPENILIKSYSRCEVKVIDFGSSCFVDDHLSSYVQSRSYRAPEVMLGLPYDQKIDLWSLGCIIAELWTGYVLFQNDSVQSLLARILGIVGEFPYHLMTRGKYVPQYFTQDGQLYQEIEGPPCPDRGRRLHLLVPKKSSLRQRMRTEDEVFLDFLEKLLQLEPSKRPTASEALQHPFLTPGRYPDGV
mmetsp:Transcript_2405/g.4401  ORF Transcript_2405/g.4401 Transcript_2405/m.4401 type:complete len:734 (-) Transcript_2405:69-2270(-)|eukprot:CAMPEP_0197624244 /NCGR_PEP_ID=MMETSP1338-20131121/3962_1 /TAXON_ID=43686 ORGANISM="Pelagodinium beii, Strain RCC1491" /NCGR_SAMPLE_ID=MMETSP1338 /ASSEMBLY_ACC=CAM_ASM_000754 /LENGTH=733 /DNA_ID=CAMNT_0043194351 /DNA_START=84 /DNA_END=2285 /DNA_ORIENTATION=-